MPRTDLVIEGDSAVVTGGGNGIGLCIADNLASVGVDVVLNDIDERALAEATSALSDRPGSVRGVAGDAADPDDVERLVSTAVDASGGLDIVVNNVGIAGPTKPCEDLTLEEFFETIEVNVGAAFNTTRAAIPHLRRSDAARIVNLSSMSGKRPLRDRTPYTTSKMGIIGFTRTLAVELAGDGVNVNAVCPGSTEGPRLDAVMEGQARSQDRPLEAVVEEFRRVSPMNRFVQPQDIADTVMYLSSDRASNVTGQDINVTAGACLY